MHDLKRAELKLVNQYIIPFSGLKDGFHEFTFDLGKEFFDEYPVLEIQDGKVHVRVQLDKKTTLLNLDFLMEGTIDVQCDRCLDYFALPIKYPAKLVVKFGDDKSTETDEIWILNPNEFELDLKQFFFESIGLCLPIKRVHPEGEDGEPECNIDMMKLLDSNTSKDKTDEVSDPRWNKLKNLLNTNNN